ncbi:hypothetical protein RUND412_005902 [Rhizina undulata]
MKAFVWVAPLLQFARAIQPTAKEPVPNQEFRDLEWGQLNFLHTTDNHGWHGGHLLEDQYSADLGDYVSFVSHMRRIADEKNVDLLVLDTGDRAEGNGLWDSSDPAGTYTRKMFKQLDVDLLTIGNHELYKEATAAYEHSDMVPYFNGRYLTSNVDINVDGEWVPMANRSLSFTMEKSGLRVTAFGFLFNFTGNYNNTRVQTVSEAILEPWFRTAVSDTDVDFFLVLGHIDIYGIEFEQIHAAIRAYHPTTPIQIFGGHTHIRNFKNFDARSTAIESGRYCETVGWLSIDGINFENPKEDAPLKFSRRYIDSNRLGYQHHTDTDAGNFDTKQGLKLSSDIAEYRLKLDLDRLVGCAPQDYFVWRRSFPGPENWYSFLQEKVLPEMVSSPERAEYPRVIIINGGSQRFDVLKGPFTRDSSYLVSPFISKFQYLADVDYRYVQQLQEYFDNDVNPYNLVPRKGRSHPSRLHPSGQSQIALSPDGTDQYTQVPGYTTDDAAGKTGDDTVHEAMAMYNPPKVLMANASFPVGTQPEKVDVIFMDFIAWNVLAGLKNLSKQELWGKGDVKWYMGQEETMTSLLLKYIDKNWTKDCVKN